MPLYTADALILRTYKLGEADRIVVFLTRDRGKKRGVAKGARRPRSPFLGALEPLTEVRVAYFEKERRELVGLNFAETVRSPLSLIGPAKAGHYVREGPAKAGHYVREGPAKAGHYVREGPAEAGHYVREGPAEAGHYVREGPAEAGPYVRERSAEADPSAQGDVDRDALGYVGYFAELLDEWAQEADADERLYRLGASMLNALAAGAPVEPLARYFEYWLLRLQGVYPESRGTLSAAAMAFLAASRSLGPDRVNELPAERRTLRELERVHRDLISMHLEKTLKSDRVLRDIRRRPVAGGL